MFILGNPADAVAVEINLEVSAIPSYIFRVANPVLGGFNSNPCKYPLELDICDVLDNSPLEEADSRTYDIIVIIP